MHEIIRSKEPPARCGSKEPPPGGFTNSLGIVRQGSHMAEVVKKIKGSFHLSTCERYSQRTKGIREPGGKGIK